MLSTHVDSTSKPESILNKNENTVVLNILQEEDLEVNDMVIKQEWLPKEINSSIYMIEVIAKIWRPKMINKYTAKNLEDDDVEDLLDYGHYGKCV